MADYEEMADLYKGQVGDLQDGGAGPSALSLDDALRLIGA